MLLRVVNIFIKLMWLILINILIIHLLWNYTLRKKPSENMKYHKFKRKDNVHSNKKSVKKSKQAASKKAA